MGLWVQSGDDYLVNLILQNSQLKFNQYFKFLANKIRINVTHSIILSHFDPGTYLSSVFQ